MLFLYTSHLSYLSAVRQCEIYWLTLKDELFRCVCLSWSYVHQFYINFNNEQFYIKLPDGAMMNFPNRLGDVKYKYFDVSGDARIVGIKIK